jgi:hypothetical protein
MLEKLYDYDPALAVLHHFAFDWLRRFGALLFGVHDIIGQKIILALITRKLHF